MKRFLAIFICTILILTMMLSGCSNSQDTQNEDKLVVGMELAYPPFETKDDDGNPTGVSVDIIKAFGEEVGKEVEIVNTAWDGLIPSLQTDKIDLIISSMTITEERQKDVDFSDPYANAMLALLVNKDSEVETAEDLNKEGMVIAVKTGSTGHIYAQENFTNATVNVFTDESACVTEVSQGKADAFIYDQLTIYRNNQENLDTTKAIYIPFQDVENWGIAVKKGNTELLNELNDFIDKFSQEGGFDEISEKYLKEEKEAFDKLNFKWFFDLSQ